MSVPRNKAQIWLNLVIMCALRSIESQTALSLNCIPVGLDSKINSRGYSMRTNAPNRKSVGWFHAGLKAASAISFNAPNASCETPLTRRALSSRNIHLYHKYHPHLMDRHPACFLAPHYICSMRRSKSS